MLLDHPENDVQDDSIFHDEEFYKVYTELQNNIVVLSAEPQIGKTGVMLYLLALLNRPVLLFSTYLRDMFDNQYKIICEKGIPGLQQFFEHNNDLQFKYYHQYREYRNQRYWKEKDPNHVIATLVKTVIDNSDSAFMAIADCRCGFGSLFKALEKLYTDKQMVSDSMYPLTNDKFMYDERKMIKICGYDLAQNCYCQNTKFMTTEAEFSFEYRQQDTKKLQNPQTFDIMVFCLSLMEENITPYMVQAFYNLKPGGTLFIAATTSTNLPQKQIANMGFVDQTSSDHDMIQIDNGKGTTNICIYKFKKKKTNVIYSPEEMKINIEMHLC